MIESSFRFLDFLIAECVYKPFTAHNNKRCIHHFHIYLNNSESLSAVYDQFEKEEQLKYDNFLSVSHVCFWFSWII